jgi:signal transduction histidine kinase
MSSKLRRTLLDLAPTVGLLGLGVAELAAGSSESGFRGPDAMTALFLVAISLPLVFRRRYPAQVLAAVFVSQGIWVTAYYHGSHQPPFEPFLAGVIACFALGYHADRRTLRVGLVVFALSVVATAVSLATGGTEIGNAGPALIWWLAAIGVGRLIHERQALVEILSDRAARLERERERDIAQAAMEERTRIARELHDVIAHSVSLMVVQASAERRLLTDQEARTADVFETIEDAGREALGELRRLLGILRSGSEPNELAPQPGLAALPDLIEESRRAGQEVAIELSGDPAPLPAGLDLAAYRIVQEALTNSRKHAAGAPTELKLHWRRDELEIEIMNASTSGAGIVGGTGHGLIGMRERAGLYGGRVEAARTPSGAFRVHAVLPLEPAAT